MGGLAGRPGSEGGMVGWHGWIADKRDFTDIMYKVVLELAIVKVKNLVLS